MNSLEAAPPFVSPMKSVSAVLVCASLHVAPAAAAQTAVVVRALVLLARVATPPLRLVPPVSLIAQMVSAATRTTAALFVAALQVRSVKVASV